MMKENEWKIPMKPNFPSPPGRIKMAAMICQDCVNRSSCNVLLSNYELKKGRCLDKIKNNMIRRIKGDQMSGKYRTKQLVESLKLHKCGPYWLDDDEVNAIIRQLESADKLYKAVRAEGYLTERLEDAAANYEEKK